jgi:hypothetical protein
MRKLTAVSLVLLVMAAPSAAPAQETPFSELDVFQVEYASDVQISPDGEWVMYVRNGRVVCGW